MQFPCQTSECFTHTVCVASRNHIRCVLYVGDPALTYDHNKKLNKPSVSKPLKSIAPRCDQSPSLLCSLSNGSVYKGGDLFQHPSSTTTSVDLCINRVTSCFELSGPSNDITHSSNFRMYPLSQSLYLSHKLT